MVRLKGERDWKIRGWLKFQFLMVRLKGCRVRSIAMAALIFQFLMRYRKTPISIPYGSIKRRAWPVYLFFMWTFQFLMVRLKVFQAFGQVLDTIISIPYGSIKRIKTRISFLLPLVISIPYGSIKSRLFVSDTVYVFISIPYGSIKSWWKNRVKTLLISIFQFLMVRLKGQSMLRSWPITTRISIPYGSIKRHFQNHDNGSCRNFNSLWFD